MSHHHITWFSALFFSISCVYKYSSDWVSGSILNRGIWYSSINLYYLLAKRNKRANKERQIKLKRNYKNECEHDNSFNFNSKWYQQFYLSLLECYNSAHSSLLFMQISCFWFLLDFNVAGLREICLYMSESESLNLRQIFCRLWFACFNFNSMTLYSRFEFVSFLLVLWTNFLSLCWSYLILISGCLCMCIYFFCEQSKTSRHH